MLPKEWRLNKFRSLVSSVDAGVSVNGADRAAGLNELGVLKISAVTSGIFEPSENKVISGGEVQRAATKPVADRVLISRSNTESLVGASAYVDRNFDNLYLPDKLWQIQPSRDNPPHMRWLAYWLASSATRAQLSKLATGTSGSMKNITKERLLSLDVPTPPSLEQGRIAEIIDTWDQAIAATDQLLANSRKQKKVLIESLVSSRKNARETKSCWEQSTLCKVANVAVSSVNKKSESNERTVQLCNYTDVYYRDCIDNRITFMQATASDNEIEKFTLRSGDVIITKDSETAADIAVAARVTETVPNLVCGYHLAMIRPDLNRIDPVFLHCYFNLPKTKDYFASSANGVTRFGLPLGAIQEAPIAFPRIDEQRKIGQIISNAELEVAGLVKDIELLKIQKQALMAQLLTGKRRVHLPDDEMEVQA